MHSPGPKPAVPEQPLSCSDKSKELLSPGPPSGLLPAPLHALGAASQGHSYKCSLVEQRELP